MTTKLTRNEPVVFHFRLGEGKNMEPKTGATVVFLPELKRFGVALCCSKDRYCKRWGRKIATERATDGSQSRRFVSSPSYSGHLNIEDVRASALALAYYAAEKVGNPLVLQGSLFITDAEKVALKNIALDRISETIKA